MLYRTHFGDRLRTKHGWAFDFAARLRYSQPMTISVPLTPHQEQFLRDQLASGRFESEYDVIRAALQMLEEHSPPTSSPGSFLKHKLDSGLSSSPSPPTLKQSWDQFRDQLRADRAPGDAALSPRRRSPRGILADIPSHLDPADIRQARREMWAGFPHGEAG